MQLTVKYSLVRFLLFHDYLRLLTPLLSRVRFARRLQQLVSDLGLSTASTRVHGCHAL
jgi:hypothetical protein